jgi:hypothetical protein
LHPSHVGAAPTPPSPLRLRPGRLDALASECELRVGHDVEVSGLARAGLVVAAEEIEMRCARRG